MRKTAAGRTTGGSGGRRGAARRQRGLGALDLVAGGVAILGVVAVVVLLVWSPNGKRKTPSGPIAATLVFLVGSGSRYEEAEGNAKAYLDMLNPEGPMAEAMGNVGSATGPMAGKSIGGLFNLPTDQLPAPLP